MHMADALLSPAVGGSMWAASAAIIGYCSRKLRFGADEARVPLMGVLGAFVFTAQMINFTIPATGSSGHLGGGLLLAALLGPQAAFLVIASVLTIQALFFADGGLLALGANIFNLGFFPCFVAYSFIYRPLLGKQPSAGRIWLAAMAAAVFGLLLGASGVVLETVASGITALPSSAFAMLMLPIHLAIGLVEGLVTAAVVNFVRKAEPSILESGPAVTSSRAGMGKVLAGFAAAVVLVGGVMSWFASSHPDGLEWAIAGVTGGEELPAGGEGGGKAVLAGIQERLAFLPDYAFPEPEAPAQVAAVNEAQEKEPAWPVVDPGTSTAGLAGGLLTLLLAGFLGFALRLGRKRCRDSCAGA